MCIIKIWKFLISGTLVSSVFKNCRWHKFQNLCGNHLWVNNHIDAFFVLRIRKCLFAWMLNFSIYLINRGWRDFKVFVEPTIYEPIIMLMRDEVIKTENFLFIWIVIISVYLINVCWDELLGFCRTNTVIYEPKITLIPKICLDTWRFTIFIAKNFDGSTKNPLSPGYISLNSSI